MLWSLGELESATPSLDEIYMMHEQLARDESSVGSMKPNQIENFCQKSYGEMLNCLSRKRYEFGDPQMKISCKFVMKEEQKTYQIDAKAN